MGYFVVIYCSLFSYIVHHKVNIFKNRKKYIFYGNIDEKLAKLLIILRKAFKNCMYIGKRN